MKKSILMLGVLCMALAMQACGDTSLWPIDPLDPKDPDNGGNNNAQLIGKEWKLRSFEVMADNSLRFLLSPQSYTLTFNAEGRASGTAYCNGYDGSYTTGANNSISMQAFVTTKMLCGDESLEGEYIAALMAAGSYEVSGQTLRIYYENGAKALNFVLETANPTEGTINDILGMNWRLASFEVTDVRDYSRLLTDIPSHQMFLLRFEANTANKLSGTANCNSYNATYQEQNGFSIYNLGSTRKTCPVYGTMEQKYYNALSNATSYSVKLGSDGELKIYYGANGDILRFVPAGQNPGDVDDAITSIIGVDFRLSEYGPMNGSMTTVDATTGQAPEFRFINATRVSGSGFCNKYYSDYLLWNNSAINFTNFTGTPDNYCSRDDKAIFDAMQSVSNYTVTSETLELYYDGGTSVLRFVRQ